MLIDNKNRLIINSIIFLSGFVYSLMNISLLIHNKSVHTILSIGLFISGLVILLLKLHLKHTHAFDDKIVLFSLMYYYISGIYLIFSMVIEKTFTNSQISVYIIRGTLLLYVVSIIAVIAKSSRESIIEIVSIKRPINRNYILLGAIFIISWTLFTSYFIVPIFEGKFQNTYLFFDRWYTNALYPTIPNMLYVIINFALLPAITEEILFRGYLQKALKGILVHNTVVKEFIVIFIVSITFMLIHGSFYSCLITIPIGIVFSMLVNITNSIKSSIVIHFTGNGFFNIFTMFIGKRIHSLSFQQAAIGIVITLGLSIVMFYILVKRQIMLAKESI